MKVYLSNQGNLRNLDAFLESLELTTPSRLEISIHDKWVTVHPANLTLTAALAVKVGKENTEIV